MPFVSRGPENKIDAVYDRPREGAIEQLSLDDAELKAFLACEEVELDGEAQAKAHLYASDLEMVRVLEDLIDILIDKGVILVTDLPDQAQVKLLERKRVRKTLRVMNSLNLGEVEVI